MCDASFNERGVTIPTATVGLFLGLVGLGVAGGGWEGQALAQPLITESYESGGLNGWSADGDALNVRIDNAFGPASLHTRYRRQRRHPLVIPRRSGVPW